MTCSPYFKQKHKAQIFVNQYNLGLRINILEKKRSWILAMRVSISNFRSIEDLKIELAPLTILIGPPASGKSNILDAIELVGYLNRFIMLDKEYGNSVNYLEEPSYILRFSEQKNLFRNEDISRPMAISILNKNLALNMKIFFEGGNMYLHVNDKNMYWDFNLRSLSTFFLKDSLISVIGGNLFEARLYAYDRYGLSVQQCVYSFPCGFHIYLKGSNSRLYPKNVLSELGWNAPVIIKSSPSVVRDINNIVEEYIGKVEVKTLRSGVITIFDHDVEVEANAVSDTIFRSLYYLLAIQSTKNYVKMYGLEKRYILLLEEPESHLFPYFIDLLAQYISEILDIAYVVTTTHNPLLISMLWDKVRDIKTYYVFRDRRGTTKLKEIDIKRLSSEIVTAEELLLKKPGEVLEKYVRG